MATNNDFLNDINGTPRGSGKTNNQLLEEISLSGGAGVTSVNGQTGIVTINASNVPYDTTGRQIATVDNVQGSMDNLDSALLQEIEDRANQDNQILEQLYSLTYRNIVTTTDSATVDDSTYLHRVDSESATTLTLPTPRLGKQLVVKNINTGSVTLVGTVDGNSSAQLATQYKYYALIGNGTSWDVEGNN